MSGFGATSPEDRGPAPLTAGPTRWIDDPGPGCALVLLLLLAVSVKLLRSR